MCWSRDELESQMEVLRKAQQRLKEADAQLRQYVAQPFATSDDGQQLAGASNKSTDGSLPGYLRHPGAGPATESSINVLDSRHQPDDDGDGPMPMATDQEIPALSVRSEEDTATMQRAYHHPRADPELCNYEDDIVDEPDAHANSMDLGQDHHDYISTFPSAATAPLFAGTAENQNTQDAHDAEPAEFDDGHFHPPDGAYWEEPVYDQTFYSDDDEAPALDFDDQAAAALGEALQPPAMLAEESHGGGGFGGTPASAAAIKGLKRQKYRGPSSGGHGTRCVICMRDYKRGKRVVVMPCQYSHRFHRKCLRKWLARSHLCPLCRHALPTEEQQQQQQDVH